MISESVFQEDNGNNDELSQLPFPEIVDGKINTEKFLAAASDVVRIIEKFGKLFSPVKYDMQGNIDKLTARYSKDKENHSTLHDMILLEKSTEEDLVATDALMWLRRALNMILLFFEKIVNDHKAGNATEDLVAFIREAYKESLERYHGWMAQQLFGLLSRMVPTRSELLQAIADGRMNKNEIVLSKLEIYLKGLRINIVNLEKFYEDNNLEM